jgi:hypothetical protein
VQVGKEQETRMRTRSLIEAYGSSDRPEHNGPEAVDQTNALHRENPDLLSAFEFLDACLLPEPDVERGPPPVDSGVDFAPAADTAASRVSRDDPPLQPPVAQSAPRPRSSDHHSRVARWRIPRGLLYWCGVGVTAGATWRLTSSLYEMAIAALVASAALIGLELLLRMVDPRIARRLGFARMHRGATFYGAGALLGLGTGLAVAHIV